MVIEIYTKRSASDRYCFTSRSTAVHNRNSLSRLGLSLVSTSLNQALNLDLTPEGHRVRRVAIAAIRTNEKNMIMWLEDDDLVELLQSSDDTTQVDE